MSIYVKQLGAFDTATYKTGRNVGKMVIWIQDRIFPGLCLLVTIVRMAYAQRIDDAELNNEVLIRLDTIV